ncbi:hypothetical protein KC357_g86 [Hortaea werneckii]|nr:hypothetical protein KC357_g86 [Hortaea werneckii]
MLQLLILSVHQTEPIASRTLSERQLSVSHASAAYDLVKISRDARIVDSFMRRMWLADLVLTFIAASTPSLHIGLPVGSIFQPPAGLHPSRYIKKNETI